MKKIIGLGILVTILVIVSFIYFFTNHTKKPQTSIRNMQEPTNLPTVSSQQLATNTSPLAIATMAKKAYPGSTFITEQVLPSGSNYHRYRVSYLSDGLKIFGLLTIPMGNKPTGGWPVILFNHGYIPPDQYTTDTSYAIMINPLASAGYIVFKPDYRGNGNSEGKASQIYVSPDYLTDSMNALASLKKIPEANSNKIGVFGHSMGANITLHQLVITHDFRAAELLAGVVGDERGILDWWNERFTAHSITGNDLDTYFLINQIIQTYATPENNTVYWNAIDPTQFIANITTPIEIQVGSADEDVPTNFSTSLANILQHAGKTVIFHEYGGADHNLSPDLPAALEQTITFFDKYLK